MAINYSALMKAAKTASTKPKNTVSTNSNFVNKNDQEVINLINEGQALMEGKTYVPGQTSYDVNFWATSGGGGKNRLYGNDNIYKATGWTTDNIAKLSDWITTEKQRQADAKAAEEEENFHNTYIAPAYQMISDMKAQQNAALQNAQKLSADQINNAYDLSARDYYQLYKTQQAKLPENLSKAGVTGGASESAQLGLMNNYSENLYKNEAARNNQLAGVNADYNNQIAQNSINAANQMANAYLQMAQQQLAYKRQDELATKEAQAQAELQAQQAAAEQAIASWNNNIKSEIEKRLADGKTVWTWTDSDGKMHWTTYESKGLANGGKKLSPSSSKVKTTNTYSSGGSSGGTSGSNNTPIVSNTPSGVSYDDVLKQARLRLSMPTFENNRITNTLNGAQGALNYIRNSGLSDAQQKKMAQQLGLI